MLKYFLWLRYLSKRKIVLLSIAAVAFCVALLIVVASLFGGFIKAFEKTSSQQMGDIVISAPSTMKIPQYDELIAELKKLDNVTAVTPVLTGQGLLHLGKGNVRAISIWGIDARSRGMVTDFNKNLLKKTDTVFTAGDSGDIEAIAGIAVLVEPDERTDEYDIQKAKDYYGKKIFFMTGTVDGPNSYKRKNIPLRVTGISYAGFYELDRNFIYVPIEKLQSALYPDRPEKIADQIQIKIKAGIDTDVAVAKINGIWRKFATERLGWSDYNITITDIETSAQLQSRYIAELRKQMAMLLLIFGAVSFSAVVLIFCIFYMIVTARRRDIAVIKSCGAYGRTIMAVFIGFGLCVGIAGSIVGAGLGYVIIHNINPIENWISQVMGLNLWRGSVYMFSQIPNEFDALSAGKIMMFAIIAAGIGAVVPAIVAARTRPVKILRYE
ncbi:MAG: ABC transporter permease [Phycisphaerae bacterium]|nr:ABC transporter permease [Phycisphaerae bacterium]